MRLTYRILGPLEVLRGDTPLPLGGAQQRALLAVLLVHANEVVPRRQLIDVVWGDDPPATVDNALQVYVSRLRRLLGDGGGQIARERHGYVLRVDPAQVDAARFEQLVREGRAALHSGDPGRAAEDLRAALSLWRGPALADLAGESFAAAAVHRLDDLRVSALEDRIEANLAVGRHAEAVTELEALVVEHPYRERLRGQLMRALYGSGRQADALAAFTAARLALDELGLEPSEELRKIQRQILSHDLPVEPPERHAGVKQAQRRRRRLVPGAIAAAVVVAAAVALAVSFAREGGSAEPSGLPSVPKNSVAVIDPDTNTVVAAIPIGSRPHGIAVGEGDVWVGAFDDRTVIRIDPRTRRVVRAIPIGGAPTRVALAGGSAWATSRGGGTVTRIDPRTSFVKASFRTRQRRFADPAFASIAREHTHEQVPVGIAGGFGSVWVAQGFSVVSRVHPRTARVLEQIDVGARPYEVAAADGRLWVTTEGIAELVVIDPQTSSVVSRKKLGGDREHLGGMAVGYGAVWIGGYDDFRDITRVWRVDTASGNVTDSIQAGRGHVRVAVGEGSVWVTSLLDGTVSRIDPETQEVVEEITLPGAVDVAVGEGAVWIAVTAERSTRR